MNPKIYVDHLGKKALIIPTGSAFSRRFSITDDWSDISLGTVWGITDTTTDATAPAGTAAINPTVPKNIGSFGIRNSGFPNLLPNEAGVNFVGSTTLGSTYRYNNGALSLETFRQGAFNGITTTTADPVAVGNAFRKIVMTLGGAYAGYAVLYQRFIKSPITSEIGLTHRQITFGAPEPDITPADMVNYITNENASSTGLTVLPYLFNEVGDNALNTVFFYNPELTVRLKLYCLVIRKNA